MLVLKVSFSSKQTPRYLILFFCCDLNAFYCDFSSSVLYSTVLNNIASNFSAAIFKPTSSSHIVAMLVVSSRWSLTCLILLPVVTIVKSSGGHLIYQSTTMVTCTIMARDYSLTLIYCLFANTSTNVGQYCQDYSCRKKSKTTYNFTHCRWHNHDTYIS